MILRGSPTLAFEDVSFVGNRNTFLTGIAHLDGRIILSSDRSIHTFDGHILGAFEPKVRLLSPPLTVSPLHVSTRDNVLMLFDANRRVLLFCDGAWTEVPVPKELLQLRSHSVREGGSIRAPKKLSPLTVGKTGFSFVLF